MKNSAVGDLMVELSITETDLFKDVIGVLGEILVDEEINQNIREKYSDKINLIADRIIDIGY